MRLKMHPRRRLWTAMGAAALVTGLVSMGVAVRGERRAQIRSGSPHQVITHHPHPRCARVPGGYPPHQSSVDAWVDAAERAVAADQKDPAAYRGLAVAFMRKQRQCGDPAYYRRAMAAIDRSLALEPGSYESRKLKAWVLSGQHRFPEAAALARQCVAERPHDPWNYGVLADTQMELGDYRGAVDSAQRMIDRKPDLASYSRAARLRELHGDPEGALQLYDLALDATSPRDPESIAWVRVQRGATRLNMGRPRAAVAEFEKALGAQRGYHLALAGQARALALLGRRREAMRLYEQALAAVPRPDWAIALGELKQAAGDRSGAETHYALARAAMAVNGSSADTDRLMALFLADHGDPQAALQHARRAVRQRDDIYTWDALAWALFKSGRYPEAWRASQRARRLGTRDAVLLGHGARIAARVPAAAGRCRCCCGRLGRWK